MAIPFVAAATSAKIISKAKAFFSSKWFWAALLLLAVGGGVYYTLNHWKNEAVTTAVQGADQKASGVALGAKDTITTRSGEVDVKMDKLRVQTTKDYTNARATVQAAPSQDRDSPAAPLLIDTLNNLDRLRQARDADSVADPDVPVG